MLTDAETPFYESYDEFANILSNTFSHTMKASYSAAALLNHEDLSDVSGFSKKIATYFHNTREGGSKAVRRISQNSSILVAMVCP